ncbi:hypothetical protein ACWGJ2_24920 [Streptomyces sp. NPDC054796]
MSPATPGPAHGRVVLLALATPVGGRVKSYLAHLLDQGTEVELVTTAPEEWERFAASPGLRTHTLRDAERRHPIPRLERALVHRLPRALPTGARAAGTLAARTRTRTRTPLAGPVARGTALGERAHRRAAGAVHRKGFLPLYRQLRPWLLARVAQRTAGRIDFATVDRVVAADTVSIALGARLARRHPSLVATTALDKNDKDGSPK